MDKVLELIKECRGSSFSRNNYAVNIDLETFARSLSLHVDYKDTHQSFEEDRSFVVDLDRYMKKITPDFQRSNNKWSKKMKVKFIENLLAGVKTELLLFRMEDYADAQIIDGLQRTTAIVDFIKGKIKPFGFSHKELHDRLRSFNSTLIIKIYTFDTWEEVGKFYIDMNENITHSKADIQKAKDWFLLEKNIQL